MNRQRGLLIQDRPQLSVLIVGATGSIGRLVVEDALNHGHSVRALVRNHAAARQLPANVHTVVGDVTRPETLPPAVRGINAIVFTLGSDGGGKAGAEAVDYGGVRNVLRALPPTSIERIVLMTAIGVTNRIGEYNRTTEAHDWKRRAERLVRASGRPYTIVRPGWFDYNGPEQHQLMFLQGDTRQAGTPSDGVVARRQIAEVLVGALTLEEAIGKTFELVAVDGAATRDLTPLFAALDADRPGSLDGVSDIANMELGDEPKRVRDELHALRDSRVATDLVPVVEQVL